MELTKLTNDQITDLIASGQQVLQERADKRREEAIEEINRRAKEVGITVAIKGKRKTGKTLKAGEKYQHPDDPTKVWVAGHGRPPKWFNVAKKVA
jgi:DNA-binding protein H-NS